MKSFFSPFIATLDFITKYFKTFVFLFIVLLVISSGDEPKQTPNLARIYLKGMIIDSNIVRAQIEEIKKYPSIKGVLFVIDSPGGAMGASVEIADLIAELNQKIPVVTHTEGAMASGSYYAGIFASKIYANRGSLIGSIGVIFNGFNAKELLDKIGIKSQTIAAGEYKEVGTFYRSYTQKEQEFLENLIREDYEIFINDVKKARKLEIDSKEFAEGKIFSAPQALKLGLIDKIGSRNEAIAELKVLSGVEKEEWLEKSKVEKYFDRFIESSASIVLGAIGGINIR